MGTKKLEGNSTKDAKEYFTGETLIKHISKLKYFPNPSRNKKRFLAACSVLRRASFSTFEVFDVARGQKRAF